MANMSSFLSKSSKAVPGLNQQLSRVELKRSKDPCSVWSNICDYLWDSVWDSVCENVRDSVLGQAGVGQ